MMSSGHEKKFQAAIYPFFLLK